MPQTEVSAVSIERSGGQVPTYRPTVKVNVESLPEKEREFLMRLLKDVDFRKPPTRSRSAIPDSFEYTLTVEDSSGTHTLEFSDQDGHPESLDALYAWLKEHSTK